MIPDPEDNRRWMWLASLFGLFIFTYIFTREERAYVFCGQCCVTKPSRCCVCVEPRRHHRAACIVNSRERNFSVQNERPKKGVPNFCAKWEKKNSHTTHVIWFVFSSLFSAFVAVFVVFVVSTGTGAETLLFATRKLMRWWCWCDMRLGFCARYILFQLMCALSIGISRTVLNGNVFELNFAFDDGRQKFSSTLKLFRQILSFLSVVSRCGWTLGVQKVRVVKAFAQRRSVSVLYLILKWIEGAFYSPPYLGFSIWR